MSWWTETRDAAEKGMTDLLQQGGNAGLGYLEKQTVAIISADQAQHEKNFQNAVAKSIATPSTGDSFSNYVSNLASSPAIKAYGPYMLLGLGVFAVGVLWMKGR